MSINCEKLAVVVSPHQDDAVISLGQLLLEFYGTGIILNVFTISDSNIQNFTGTEEITRVRDAEEKSVITDYKVEVKNGGFKDCELRGIAWDNHLANVDLSLLTEVSDWILRELSNIDGKYDLFMPAAFGLHPDHYLTILAFTVDKILTLVRKRVQNIYLYGEQPYLSENNGRHCGHAMLQGFTSGKYPIASNIKSQMLGHYPSQLSSERREVLSELPYEYYWEATPIQLEEFLLACLRRNEVGAFDGFSRRDWLEKVEASYQSPSREFLTIVTQSSKDKDIVFPLVIETITLPKVGIVKLARFAGVFVSDYFSVNPDVDQEAYLDLKQQLEAMGIDGVWFSNIRVESEFSQIIKTLDHGEILSNIPSVGLFCDLSFDQWLVKKSKNMRKNAKRKFESLSGYAESLGESIEFVTKPASTDSIRTLLANQQTRADQKGFDAFIEKSEFSSFVRSLKDTPSVLAGELKVGDRILSSLLFFVDEENKSIAFYMQSFDAQWERFSPSFCAIIKLIEYAHDNGFLYVDFLRGDEDYKRHFTDNKFEMIKFVDVINNSVSLGNLVDFVSSYEE